MGRSCILRREKEGKKLQTAKERNRERNGDEQAEVCPPIFYWELGKLFFHLASKAGLSFLFHTLCSKGNMRS